MMTAIRQREGYRGGSMGHKNLKVSWEFFIVALDMAVKDSEDRS